MAPDGSDQPRLAGELQATNSQDCEERAVSSSQFTIQIHRFGWVDFRGRETDNGPYLLRLAPRLDSPV